MKMIDVLQKLANGEIKEGTKIILNDYLHFIFNGRVFESDLYLLENCMFLKEEDLNQEVELILPKEKKYLVKFNMRWLKEYFRYLNYCGKNESIEIHTKTCTDFTKTHFTKDELQSIKSVREFLEDMEGKYELIEVEDIEID